MSHHITQRDGWEISEMEGHEPDQAVLGVRSTQRGMTKFGVVMVGIVQEGGSVVCGFVSGLAFPREAPPMAIVHLMRAAATWMLSRGVPGVLIHVEGGNNERAKRRFYDRLGFVDVAGIPGMRSAPVDLVAGCLGVEVQGG